MTDTSNQHRDNFHSYAPVCSAQDMAVLDERWRAQTGHKRLDFACTRVPRRYDDRMRGNAPQVARGVPLHSSFSAPNSADHRDVFLWLCVDTLNHNSLQSDAFTAILQWRTY